MGGGGGGGGAVKCLGIVIELQVIVKFPVTIHQLWVLYKHKASLMLKANLKLN